MAKIFDYIEVSYDKLTNQMNDWLKYVYSKSNILFSEASPFGMILKMSKEMFTHTILYNKNSVAQMDVQNSTVPKVIRNWARISGHNPSRGISATGTIKLKLKVGVSIYDEIKGGKITIKNKTELKNKSNNLYYTIITGVDNMLYEIAPNMEILLNVVQGKYEKQSFTGSGFKNQSLSVSVPNNKLIENFNYTITYNGIELAIRDHLYDMLPYEYACVTRTGFNGGLDIYFGTGDYGFVPAVGSLIEIDYLLTDGTDGNILNNKINDFKFMTDVMDEQNNIVTMEKVFDTYIENDINLGTDAESVAYMRSVIAHVSRNFVLASPEQFIYHLKKLNLFSKINAYNLLDERSVNSNKYIDYFVKTTFGNVSNVNLEDIKQKLKYYFPNVYDNQIFLYLIPNIRNYFTQDYNYFNVPFDVFYLDDTEKAKVIQYLKKMGIIGITTNINIINPNISLYVVNIFVRRFSEVPEESIRNDINNVMSEYFINNDRFDRIVKSDIIKTLKNNVEGIDSVNLDFVCKKNEDYHKKGMQSSLTINDSVTFQPTTYDKNLLLGIDGVQGDIIMERDEIAILRGGWYDRNGFWYSDIQTIDGLSTINVIITGVNDNIRTS